MKQDNKIFFISLFLFAAFLVGCSDNVNIPEASPSSRTAKIQPDYTGIIVPPNIAPLNFKIDEKGEDFIAVLQPANGNAITIHNKAGIVQVPEDKWKQMLSENEGKEFSVKIFIKEKEKWLVYNTIVNKIAKEKIDSYVTYRKFGPLFNQWGKMGIYQRSLEAFDEHPVLINKLTKDNCMNCHNFWQNGTDRWLMHLRGGTGTSMLLTVNDEVKKIDTRSSFSKSPGAYPAWHPSGNLVAFSAGKPLQFFHTVGETRDELDRSLDIFLYNINTNTATTTPDLSSNEKIEVWPAWSADGKYLYFCTAPKLDTYQIKTETGDDSLAYDQIKYDLVRISYDEASQKWGTIETVISSAATGLSITQPRISPDGNYLVYTASAYGSFPIFHSDADLYLLDLKDNTIEKLELNSDRAETFHSWSANNRWIVFSSKRDDTQFTRLYFSYIDENGKASKPFILPQEDPSFYDTCLEIYNVPELVNEKIKQSPKELAGVAHIEDPIAAKTDPRVIINKQVPPLLKPNSK